MIVGATFSFEGNFTTIPDYETKTVVIRTTAFPFVMERKLEFRELPAFIEYLENNNKFQISDNICAAPTGRWMKLFIENLKGEMKRMEESA